MGKKSILSGITTTGQLTIGNYIGAVLQWKQMIEDFEAYFMVADLHSLTNPQEKIKIRDTAKSFFAQYIAMGLDPNQCTLFLQSHVPAHSELYWILSNYVSLGHLQRMTQYKDKTAKKESPHVGYLMYPVLMAADILLYQADYVPVGEDQKQHLELCRDIVGTFHHQHGEGAIKVPEPFIPKQGARIMSLADPTAKMSKSDPKASAYIALLDEPDVVLKKIKKATTDSGTEIKYDDKNPGIANLMTIYSTISKKSLKEVENHFVGKNYGSFKTELADLIIEQVTKPIGKKYAEIMEDQDALEKMMLQGAEKASLKASRTLQKVQKKIGLR